MGNLDTTPSSVAQVRQELSSTDLYDARKIVGGLALLHTPDATQPLLAPELLSGCDTVEDKAVALVTHASRLVIEGYYSVYRRVGVELKLASGNVLRDAPKQPIIDRIDEVLNNYYAVFHHGLIDGIRTMPTAIGALRPNPYRNADTYKKLIRDRASLTPIELVDSLSVPPWIINTGITSRTLAELGIST